MEDGEKRIAKLLNRSENGVLVTGATGFVGSALVEKFLRLFPKMRIFVLMRPKRDLTAQQRFAEYKKLSVFERLRSKNGDEVFEMIQVVEGDVDQEGLGINESVRVELQKKVNMVFHCAATLDFEADLYTSTITNLRGTQQVLEFCKKLHHCRGYVHVSTAFVNADREGTADEVIYPVEESAEKVLTLIDSLSRDAFEAMAAKLIGNHPNAYTFTKKLAEIEVSNAFIHFPTAIVRPSMILGAWKEPIAGWTSSKNGPQGFLMGAAKGVLRRLPINTDLIYDYIPIDVVINYMIIAMWHLIEYPEESRSTPIYHATTSTINPFRWRQVEHNVDQYLHEYPLMSALWYPALKFMPSMTRFKISALIFHFLPAVFLDLLIVITGGKTRLIRLHMRVIRSLKNLEPFIFNEWKFLSKKGKQLEKLLDESEKEQFFLDTQSMNWNIYFLSLAFGIRRYLNKEDPKTLKRARTKDKVLLGLNLLLQFGLLALFFYLGIKFTSYPYGTSVVILLLITLIQVFL